MTTILPVVKAYNSGESCDLKITCGESTFHVHKLVVCNACEFFKKACNFKVGKEAEDNHIDLPEDDPEMIRRLIMFCYLREYDPVCSQDLVDIETFKDCRTQGALSEKYHSRYPNSRVEHSDYLPNLCACCVISDEYPNQGGRHKRLSCIKDEAQLENPLTVHASMYALADKYFVDGLADEAVSKYSCTLSEHWHTADFVDSVSIAYTTTPEGNRRLRDAVLYAFEKYLKINLEHHPDIERLLANFNLLNLTLLMFMKTAYEEELEKVERTSAPKQGDAQQNNRGGPDRRVFATGW